MLKVPAGIKKRKLYARRDLVNGEEFVVWAKAQGFDTVLLPDKLHCTLIYSKVECHWGEHTNLIPRRDLITASGGARSFDRLGNEGAVVLRFQCAKLRDRVEQMKKFGAVSDYPIFKAHITITYNAGDISLANLKPFEKPLLFGPEIFEEITKDFSAVDALEKSRPKYV